MSTRVRSSLPPLPTALQDCHLNGVKAQVLPEFPKALLSSLSPQNSLCSSHMDPLAAPSMNEDCSGPRAFAQTVPSAQTILPPRIHSVPSLTSIRAFSDCHLLDEAVPTIPFK